MQKCSRQNKIFISLECFFKQNKYPFTCSALYELTNLKYITTNEWILGPKWGSFLKSLFNCESWNFSDSDGTKNLNIDFETVSTVLGEI